MLKNLLRLAGSHWLVAAIGIAVAGCGGLRAPPIVDAFRFAAKGMPDAQVTREQVDSMPYASIFAKSGNGPRAFLVLGQYDQDDLHWISADRAVLVTRGGRLVKTVGFDADLRNTLIGGRDPIIGDPSEIAREQTFVRRVDITPGNRFGIPLTSRYEVGAADSIEILGRRHDTFVVKEYAVAPLLDWEFENTYWVDTQTGFIWQSIQHFAPEMPPVQIQVLKPAR